MPSTSPLPVNREAVRTLAGAVGQREAARRLDLNENTVKSICYRAGDDPNSLPPSQLARTQTAPKSPATAMREAMQDMDGKGRFALATGLLAGAEHVASLPGESVLAQAPEIASLVKSTASVHGWSDGSASTVRVSIYSGEQPVLIDVEAQVEPITGQDS